MGKPRKYASRWGLKRHHGPLAWSNSYQIDHPNVFRRYLWVNRKRKVPPVANRRRIDRHSGVTYMVSDRVPYRGVTIFVHVLAERLQNVRLNSRGRMTK